MKKYFNMQNYTNVVRIFQKKILKSDSSTNSEISEDYLKLYADSLLKIVSSHNVSFFLTAIFKLFFILKKNNYSFVKVKELIELSKKEDSRVKFDTGSKKCIDTLHNKILDNSKAFSNISNTTAASSESK